MTHSFWVGFLLGLPVAVLLVFVSWLVTGP